MAVSIMRELAHRLELTNKQLRTALSELRELREGATARRAAGRRRGRMSRLDSFIRRLEAQRACLEPGGGADPRDRRDRAGAGSRQRPDLRPSARAVPGPRHLCLRAQGRGASRLRAASGISDPRRHARDPAGAAGAGLAGGSRWRISTPAPAIAAGKPGAGRRTDASIIVPLLCRGGVLVSDPPIEAAELELLPLPDGVAAGRYHLYRRNQC